MECHNQGAENSHTRYIDKLESQLDHASREINRFNAELAQLREQIETVTKILQSHTDPAACEADKCGCVGETLEELTEGAREEIASLRADNAVLADEVRTLRRCTTTQSYVSARLARDAKDATNASGALERGGVKAQSAIDAVTDHAAIGEVCLTLQAEREEIAELKRKNGLLAREVMSCRLPPEGERAGTNRRIAIKQARAATDAGGGT